MNVLLQRHCAKYIYAVPDGLRELMSDITREVLRSQPENIYTFVADYLDALMITRENARVAARLVEHITEISITIVDLLLRTGMSREEADAVARVIQNAFRRYLQRKEKEKLAEVYGMDKDEEEEDEEGEYRQQEFMGSEEEQFVAEVMSEIDVEEDKQHSAARIIQAAYRKFKRRQEMEKDLLYGMVDWRIAARHTISLYRHAGVSEWEANRAATLIKAAYKGYYTRRVMKKLLEKGLEESVEEEEESILSTSDTGSKRTWESEIKSNSLEEEDELKKSVRINFDTVIPHVDFDEPTVIAADTPEGVEPLTLEEVKGEESEGGGEILGEELEQVEEVAVMEQIEEGTVPEEPPEGKQLETIPEESEEKPPEIKEEPLAVESPVAPLEEITPLPVEESPPAEEVPATPIEEVPTAPIEEVPLSPPTENAAGDETPSPDLSPRTETTGNETDTTDPGVTSEGATTPGETTDATITED